MTMRELYTAEIQDDDGAILTDFDVEVAYTVEDNDGPELSIDAIYMDRSFRRPEGGFRKAGETDLLTTLDPFLRQLGCRIASQVEANDKWISKQIAAAGYHYVTRGGTDPMAHWARSREEALS